MTENLDNQIFVGDKGLGIYISAAMRKLSQGSPEIIIRGRGPFIEKAILIQRLVKKNLKGTVIISKVELVPEQFLTKKGINYESEALAITLKKN